MGAYRLTAPTKHGRIEKGYSFIVNSPQLGSPAASDIEAELRRLGFDSPAELGYRSSGNWIVEKL